MYWYPDRLLRAVLTWTLICTIFVMLVAWRGGIDPTYIWGFVSFRGPGASNDYWGMLVLATLGWSLLYSGLRGARPPFHATLLAWNFIMTYLITRYAVEHGEAATIQGQAWGFEFRLDVLGPALFGLFSLLAVVWVVRDWRSGMPERAALPNPYAKRCLAAAGAIVPVQLVLWWPGVGEYNGPLHATAVGFTVVQTLLVAFSMLPGKPTAVSGTVATVATNGSLEPPDWPRPKNLPRESLTA